MGNWKMNPSTLGKAQKLFLDIRKGLGRRKTQVEIAVTPPTPFLSELSRMSPSNRIHLGAQDVSHLDGGAHTGEVSVSMIKSVGAEYVIAGHSERRAAGESDEEIYKDIRASIKAGLQVVVCVGEQHRDAHGNYFGVVEAQLRAAIDDLTLADLKKISIAYEPVWAIGTGETATPADAEEMRLFIQKIIADHFGRKAVDAMRILYGGSVKKTNAAALLTNSQIDGFLIGGASLKASEFVNIVNIAEQITKKHAKPTTKR
ncbi:MAG: triose-phosphate isomerase [Bacteroidota bacterium]